MRQLVNSTQLDHWFTSARRDAQELLPHLVRRLILSTISIEKLKVLGIAAGDDIRRRGYDGQVHSAATHPFVAEGISVWEMGTGDAAEKFRKDYANRTDDPRGIDRAAATFVFVTPHSWEGKSKVEADAKREGKWKDVKILDSSDLETWIEAAPAVARWLAAQMSIPIEGMDDISMFVRLLESKYSCRFLPDMVIGGRDDASQAVQRFLFGEDPVVTLDAESPEEAAAFVCAAVERLPDQDRERARARTIIAYEPAAIDYLAGTSTPLIVVPVGAEVARQAKARASKTLRVVTAQIRRADAGFSEKTIIRLGGVHRQAIRDSLKSSGMDESRADRIAKECKGSLTAALMMVSVGPDQPLPWAESINARKLAPLVLAGQWVPGGHKDREAVGKLANVSEQELADLAATWAGPIGPLVRRGAVQDWLAWDFAWRELANAFDGPLLDRFVTAIREVLLTADPEMELKPDQRWQASILGKQHPYSHALRSGLVGSIVQFGLNDAHVPSRSGQSLANYFVQLLLGDDEPDRATRWFSLATFLPDLAEASPEAFLEAAEALTSDEQSIATIFAEGGVFPSSRHTYLLWALERLAWSPVYLGRATVVLGKLATVDPGGQSGNRPSHSLREIYIPWHPSTAASVADRLNAIDALNAATPRVAWRLALSLMPQGHDVASPTDKPRWRPWPTSNQNATVQDYWSFIRQLVQRALEWSKGLPDRIVRLVPVYDDLWHVQKEAAEEFIREIAEEEVEAWPDTDKAALMNATRELIAKHREHAEADWAIPSQALDAVAKVHDRALPSSLADRHAWLFAGFPTWTFQGTKTFEEREKIISEMREEAVRQVIAAGGINGLKELMAKSKHGSSVGVATGRVGLSDQQEAELLSGWISRPRDGGDTDELNGACQTYIAISYASKGGVWLEQIIGSDDLSWSGQSLAEVAMTLPPMAEVWDRVESWQHSAGDIYWKTVPLGYVANAARDLRRAVQTLIKYNRFYRAVNLIGGHSYSSEPKGALPVEMDLIVQVLSEAVKHNPKTESGGTDLGSLSHHVSQLLDLLEAAGLPKDTLAKLEWEWMPALQHTSHGLRTLQLVTVEDPASFVHLLKLAFKGEGDPPRELSEGERAAGRQAHELLRELRRVPGLINVSPGKTTDEGDVVFPNGEVDEARLRDWVVAARSAAEESRRLRVCDSMIGHILAYAPYEADGVWPCVPVRNLIELVGSDDLDHGVAIGVHNKRGVHFVEPGGKQELRLAEKFRGFANAVRSRWPRTGQILAQIISNYEREAKDHIEREQFGEFE